MAEACWNNGFIKYAKRKMFLKVTLTKKLSITMESRAESQTKYIRFHLANKFDHIITFHCLPTADILRIIILSH